MMLFAEWRWDRFAAEKKLACGDCLAVVWRASCRPPFGLRSRSEGNSVRFRDRSGNFVQGSISPVRRALGPPRVPPVPGRRTWAGALTRQRPGITARRHGRRCRLRGSLGARQVEMLVQVGPDFRGKRLSEEFQVTLRLLEAARGVLHGASALQHHDQGRSLSCPGFWPQTPWSQRGCT